MLLPENVEIIAYQTLHREAFRDLNHEWITKFFALEAADSNMLENPERYILEKGGYIFMALLHGEPVGTVALIKNPDGSFELAKMAVTDKAKGLKIGYALGKVALEKASEIKAPKVELLSNRKLAPALNLYKKLGFEEVPLPPNDYQRADIKMEIRF
ncbi:GNAT family N-acetyltransferase [Adhaeribacter sp. BT258]|uniref:GNAT family N-acetyltransferase n=1 Tax=Adhaeribacter terrigena TaxID=2793070 RepID=A0ABS1C3R4_9BACT|nr:GNAT family N-acetyltransferase [Adhaeribacter terrigena]MBK0404038.1 GNAT family N-acetyltransferase [Adhaeribacter terrigena]